MPVLGPSMHPGGLRGFSMVRLPVALLLGQVLEENDVKRVGSVCGRGLGERRYSESSCLGRQSDEENIPLCRCTISVSIP